MEINKYIDHTNLKPDCKESDIIKLCSEANYYKFKSVCVNPQYVSLAYNLLKDTDVLVCTVVGFPLGQNITEIKAYEATLAIRDGASEIDMVVNVSKIKDNDYDYIRNEIKALVEVCNGLTLKVIIETSLLTDDEIYKVSKVIKESGAQFVKTSTGFLGRGASVNDIKIIKEAVGDFDIKASGGIKSYKDCIDLINAGATRIGSSKSVLIMEELNNE